LSKTHLRRALPLAGIVLINVSVAVLSPGRAASRARVGNRVLRRALDAELGRAKTDEATMSVSSSVLYTILEKTGGRCAAELPGISLQSSCPRPRAARTCSPPAVRSTRA
jgi:hypothetical protein